MPIDLSEIELHYYNDTLDRQRELLDLPVDRREPRAPDWELDRTVLRGSLLNLRQICTHIQVGQMQLGDGRRDQRLQLGRHLMTMAEALEKIRDDHSQEFLIESRLQVRLHRTSIVSNDVLQLRAMVRKAQLLVLDENDSTRYLKAAAVRYLVLQALTTQLYEKIRDRVTKQLEPVRQHLERLIGNREDDGDDHDETPERNMSQQEKERASAITATRQT